MTVAKALGGGLPIGACLAAPDFADVLQPGDHGSTFAGGPVTATVALAVLEIVDDPELLRRVRELGATLCERLEALDGVREVRGRGLMLGVALEDGIDAAQLSRSLLELGLVANVPEPGTLRLLPPIVIEEDEIERGRELIQVALDRA
jgi:acetylornithine/succinyldiaminopimelate/putrescine aminotransferase